MIALFSGNFWLVGLAYLVAAMALVYAMQLQFSMRPGGKPVRGMPMWREPLPDDIANVLRTLPPPIVGTGTAESKRGFTFTTTLAPEPDANRHETFVHTRAQGARGAPTPYNATIHFDPAQPTMQPKIAYRLSPLAPLVYLGLVALVFMIFETPLIGVLFALFVATLFGSTVYQTRLFVLAGLRVPLAPQAAQALPIPETTKVKSG